MASQSRRSAAPRAASAPTRARCWTLSTWIEPTRAILDRAVEVDPPTLRASDAVHLAFALFIEELRAFVAYDERLLAAAEAAGLRAVSPL